MKTKLLVLYYIIFLGTILRIDSKCLITWLCVSLWDCLRSRKWRKPTGSLGLRLGLSIVLSPGYTLPVMSAWATNNTHSSWSGEPSEGSANSAGGESLIVSLRSVPDELQASERWLWGDASHGAARTSQSSCRWKWAKVTRSPSSD